MKKVLAFTLLCAICSGCQSGGQGWPGSAFSSSAPPATASNLAANAAAPNGQTATGPATQGPATNPAGANGAGQTTPVSTLGKIWSAFTSPQQAPAQPAPVSPEMARFNNFVGAIATQTAQLNINDPPEVTRQKAEGILTTLRDWDSVLAAGRSMGVINDATANTLTLGVQRLTAETQKLVQYAPSPATIDAVKQLGGSLGAAYAGVQGILAQGTSISQTLLGGTTNQ